MGRGRTANPVLDAARGAAADLGGVEHPRPRVTAGELRARANRTAVALAVAFEELSDLQRAIGASEVEPPAPPRLSMRTMTDAELRARAEAPGWAPWDEISAPDEDGGAGRE